MFSVDIERLKRSMKRMLISNMVRSGRTASNGGQAAVTKAKDRAERRFQLYAAHDYAFDWRWYADTHGFPAAGRESSHQLRHFVAASDNGWNAPPAAWFDGLLYASSFAESDNINSMGAALEHFLSSTPQNTRRFSPYFDSEYYMTHYPSVTSRIESGQSRNVLEDYLRYGIAQRYSPSEWFEEVWYTRRNRDVASDIASGRFLSGFHHYLVVGRFEKRDPGPRFSEARYLSANRDVAIAPGFPCGFDHWVRHGRYEGRDRGNEKVLGSVLNGA